MQVTKPCSSCGEELPLESFRKQSATKDGLKYQCISCNDTYSKKRYANKKTTCISLAMNWQRNNPEKVREYRRKWEKSPIGRIRRNLRKRIRRMVDNPTTSINRSVGCSSSELKKHIEAKFVEGMSWDNYGEVWQIDHIRPLSSFNLSQVEEINQANHYTNLQPLFSKDNLNKGNSWNGVI